jgi:hypothetical protein
LSGWVVFRVSAVAALACVVLAAALPSASGKPSAAPRCGLHPDSSPHWEAVFGHATSVAQANLIRRELGKGFKGLQLEKDYCDDIEVEVPGFDTPEQRAAFAQEADASHTPVSFEAPDNQKQNRPGEVSAVFGHRPTLKRASELLGQVAMTGWRTADIIRLDLHDWKVVLRRVPVGVQNQFAAEARGAGYSVTFER